MPRRLSQRKAALINEMRAHVLLTCDTVPLVSLRRGGTFLFLCVQITGILSGPRAHISGPFGKWRFIHNRSRSSWERKKQAQLCGIIHQLYDQPNYTCQWRWRRGRVQPLTHPSQNAAHTSPGSPVHQDAQTHTRSHTRAQTIMSSMTVYFRIQPRNTFLAASPLHGSFRSEPQSRFESVWLPCRFGFLPLQRGIN